MTLDLASSHRLIHFADIDSTNAEAHRQAEAGECGPLWIWADKQTKGRGRLGRCWVSEPGNLYATFLFPISAGPALASQISFVAALAVFDMAQGTIQKSVISDNAAPTAADRGLSIPVAAHGFAPDPEMATVSGILGPRSSLRSGGDDTQYRVSLKWPNDVLINGRKFSGILPEAIGRADGKTLIALGCGINIASAPSGTPYPVTSLAQNGASASVAQCLERLSHAMADWLAIWNDGKGFAPIREAWLKRAIGLGGPVRAGEVSGTFTGLAPDGALVVTLPSGSTRHVHAGEVRFAELDSLRAVS